MPANPNPSPPKKYLPGSRAEDLTGREFDDWTVLGFSHRSAGSRGVFWRCRCRCGAERPVKSSKLLYRESRRCLPCGRKHGGLVRVKPDTAVNSVLRTYRNNAKTRGYEWSLGKEHAESLLRSPCEYCGASPLNKKKSGSSAPDLLYNGIDRVDNTLGYIQNNVVACCSTCNAAKCKMTADAFISWATRVADHNRANP